MMNYHVADFIIRIKNASRARRSEVWMPYSNLNKAIGQALVKEGFLSAIREESVKERKQLVATVRFVNRRPAVAGVAIASKPSLRVYATRKALGKAYNPSVTSILSTSKGVMSGREANKKGIGGELLFQIW